MVQCVDAKLVTIAIDVFDFVAINGIAICILIDVDAIPLEDAINLHLVDVDAIDLCGYGFDRDIFDSFAPCKQQKNKKQKNFLIFAINHKTKNNGHRKIYKYVQL